MAVVICALETKLRSWTTNKKPRQRRTQGARGWHRMWTCTRHVWEPSVWKSASSYPSHPNSSFNLVHDHLKQRAHAHASVNTRDEHPWCTRGCTTYTCPRCLFRRRFSLKVPNSLPSLYYHHKKRAIVNLALSNAPPFTAVKTHREFSIEWSRDIPRNSITRREPEQGRVGSNLLRYEKLAWRALKAWVC